MSRLVVCGLLVLLGAIFAAMILVGFRWCGRRRPVPEHERGMLGPSSGPGA